MPYNNISKPAAFVPENIVRAVMDDIRTDSAALTLGRRLSVPSTHNIIPLPTTLPEAYWVDGEKPDPKQTTKMEWSRETLQVFEMAALMPVPDAYIEDASIPVWDEVRPYIVQAISRRLDQTVLFGLDKPAAGLTSVVEHATAAGNVVALPAEPEPPAVRDVVPSVMRTIRHVGRDGYAVDGLAVRPGFEWEVAEGRVNALAFDPANPVTGRLFGMPLFNAENGGWDYGKAEMIAGRWSNLYIGVRRDIRIEFSNSGTVRDPATGAVTVSAWQDDVTILRIVFRAGWRIVNPVNATNPNTATRSPFAVLTPAALAATEGQDEPAAPSRGRRAA